MSSIFHLLRPKNYDESFLFYQKKLSFKLLSQWGEKSGERGAVFQVSDSFKIILTDETDAEHAHDGMILGKPSLVVEVEDLKGHFQKLEKETNVCLPLEINQWGRVWFAVQDPDENIIVFQKFQHLFT